MRRLGALIAALWVFQSGGHWYVRHARFSSVWYEIPARLAHFGSDDSIRNYVERCLAEDPSRCVRHSI